MRDTVQAIGAMRKTGLTQQVIARKSGISQSTICRWGKESPVVFDSRKMAKLLKLADKVLGAK